MKQARDETQVPARNEGGSQALSVVLVWEAPSREGPCSIQASEQGLLEYFSGMDHAYSSLCSQHVSQILH